MSLNATSAQELRDTLTSLAAGLSVVAAQNGQIQIRGLVFSLMHVCMSECMYGNVRSSQPDLRTPASS